jgi:alpha-L-arabinofuranosidase
MNPAWTGVEHNDFGLDEFVAFCREVGAEPLIVANSGFGDDHSAAEEVEYANGSTDTPMGRWRAFNGHPEPYNVKWWGIGNEMYGKWQLGYMVTRCTANGSWDIWLLSIIRRSTICLPRQCVKSTRRLNSLPSVTQGNGREECWGTAPIIWT